MKLKSNKEVRTYRFGITEKVFGIFILVTFIPLFMLLIANRFNTSKQAILRSAASYENVFYQTANYLDDKTATVKAILDMIASDANIQDLNILEDVYSSYTSGNWVMYDYVTHEIIFKSYLNKNISRIFLYLNQSEHNFSDSDTFRMLNKQTQTSCLEWFDNSKNNRLWLTPENMHDQNRTYTYIYCISKIPSSKVLNKNLGLLQADIPLNTIKSILSGATVTNGTHVLLINDDNRVFASNGDTQLGNEFITEAIELIDASDSINKLTSIVLNENQYLAGIDSIENTDWRLLFLVPYHDILEITRETDRAIMITMIVIIICLIPAFFLTAQLMTKRIRALNRRVIAASSGDYSVRVEPGTNDEIGQLSSNFNYMMNQTIKMMDEQYQMGQALKNAEIQVLQEQINPHFLYNTLELIHWMALRSNNHDIDNVALRLSQFYKLSLGDGEEIVSVSHELMHVEAYVDIQNLRFNNCIQLVIDVPKKLRSYSIVKIVFQPLVENSIQHGIRKKDDKTGTITIKGSENDEEIIFTISDNGVGIEDNMLASIIQKSYSGGYGIYNINERLVLHYGDSSELEYISCKGTGTTVTFRIPKIPFSD